MSIESHPWDREAFTLTSADKAWTAKRRAFPPRLDPAQDRTNVEGKKHYLNSLIHLFTPRPSMELCVGVSGFLVGQTVNYSLFTDSIYAEDLTFTSIVASFALLHCSNGQEVVARSAYLYDGTIDTVACSQGILCEMKINMLIIAKAVVLHNCSVVKILIDPLLQSGPLRSIATFQDKILCNDLGIESLPLRKPIVVLLGTSQRPSMDNPAAIWIVQNPDLRPTQLHKPLALSVFSKWKQFCINCPLLDRMDRGAFWGLGSFYPSSPLANASKEFCVACHKEILPSNQVVGHLAPNASDPAAIHYACIPCFQELTETIPAVVKKLACPLCTQLFHKMALSPELRIESMLDPYYLSEITGQLAFGFAWKLSCDKDRDADLSAVIDSIKELGHA